MIPSDDAIAQVMRDTGMGRMQAINHLRGRQAVREMLDRQRRGGEPYQPAPRSFVTHPFTSYVPPASFDRPATLHRLRVYGSGRCTLGEGNPGHYPTKDAAEAAGKVWVETGVAPADQRRDA